MGTSRTRSRPRTMSSSAILKPMGRRLSVTGTARRSKAKNPDIGSAQSASGRASSVASREPCNRHRLQAASTTPPGT